MGNTKDLKRAKEHYKIRKQKILDHFGNICLLCNYEGKYGGRMALHEIYWKKHSISLWYYEKHLSDFVCLCFRCHQAAHWLHDMFDLDWSQVLMLVNFLKSIKNL